MMTFLTVLVTVLLVLDCLILGLLILVQLPKKEAGLGMAFGGGAADALFGAGSGTALTKLTKYTAGAFFVLVILLSAMHTLGRRSSMGDLLGKTAPPTPPLQQMGAATTNVPAEGLNLDLSNAAPATNVTTTNAPGQPK